MIESLHKKGLTDKKKKGLYFRAILTTHGEHHLDIFICMLWIFGIRIFLKMFVLKALAIFCQFYRKVMLFILWFYIIEFYRYTNSIKYVGYIYYTLIPILISFRCKPQVGSFSSKYFGHNNNCEYICFFSCFDMVDMLQNQNFFLFDYGKIVCGFC